MRRFVLMILAVCVIVPVTSFATARADGSGADQAARDIADARARANSAGQAYFDQESKIDQLNVEQQRLQTSVVSLQKTVNVLETKVTAVAVNRYVTSASHVLPLLTGFKSADDRVQMDALIDVINDNSADDFDRYRALDSTLQSKKQQLADKQSEAEREQARLATLKVDAMAEVENLKNVEAGKLKDQAVQRALVAELARRDRADALLVEKQKQQSATIPTDPSTDPSATGSVPSAAVSANADDAGGGFTGLGGSAAGGRTGSGGTGFGAPAAGIGGVGGDYGSATWMCPTGSAAMAFTDTWGAPRSGGRRHEGVDLIGTRGTPILAVVDGVAVGKQNDLGGTTISFDGTDGNHYYYAHLDSYGTLGTVTRGTVIGYLGQTGNARFSVPHLHFEIHPGGGPAVDPYPTTRAHCPSPG